MLDKILKLLFVVLFGVAGLVATNKLMPYLQKLLDVAVLKTGFFGITLATIISFIFGALIGGLIGYLIAPILIKYLWKATSFVELSLKKTPLSEVLIGALGLAIGLIISNLLGFAFLPIPLIGSYVPLIFSIILGALGIKLALSRKSELAEVLSSLSNSISMWFGRPSKKSAQSLENSCSNKILDTNVIIDGRIADICKTGFIEGALIIPIFVLEELQHIADSSDLLKRTRGRRGLDILNKMQKDPNMNIQIDSNNFDDTAEVDSKLIRLSKILNAIIITNDYNLNKVAEFQGVKVLNINELSNAIKPVVLPGEEMVVQVVKDGKEPGQGVAYLDDGTMIVVEGGKKHMGETLEVLVTSVLQTAAGRMIFAKPKSFLQ